MSPAEAALAASGQAPKPAPKAPFVWDDPLLLDEQLREEERMVRDAAHEYCQGQLMPRIL